jgi:hypothetical protein
MVTRGFVVVEPVVVGANEEPKHRREVFTAEYHAHPGDPSGDSHVTFWNDGWEYRILERDEENHRLVLEYIPVYP